MDFSEHIRYRTRPKPDDHRRVPYLVNHHKAPSLLALAILSILTIELSLSACQVFESSLRRPIFYVFTTLKGPRSVFSVFGTTAGVTEEEIDWV